MMENVPGLVDRGKRLFQEFLETLNDLNYRCTWRVLQVADYGVPQKRRRLVLVAAKGFALPLPEPTHHRIGKGGLPRWKTLRDAISDVTERPVLLEDSVKSGGPQQFNWHVVRRLSSTNMERLRKAKPGASRALLPTDIRPECHKTKETGYTNVYGRMTWDQVPVTITGGCTTLSKGRFGHPSDLRTISVREAARIQTFPDDYVFDTPYMEYVCEMIGNALPCDFAETIGASIAGKLRARW
jgi:DNA (cytosine-5)-methyltransferase 1